MVISARKLGPVLSARATKVAFTKDTLLVYLEDSRHFSVPIVWFPRLAEATDEQRQHWRLIGRGIGISWDEIDEDISVENLLGTAGQIVLISAGAAGALVESALQTVRKDPEGEPSSTPPPTTT